MLSGSSLVNVVVIRGGSRVSSLGGRSPQRPLDTTIEITYINHCNVCRQEFNWL